MEKLWAPWRLDFLQAEPEDTCFLCRAIAGQEDRECLLVFRGERCGVMLNRYPYNNGHLLVFPYGHVPDMAALDAAGQLEMVALMNRSVAVLRRVLRAQGFNIGINIGKTAGACLESHLHLHVVPRWNGDTNYMAVVTDTRVIPQALDAAWEQLHAAFAEDAAGGSAR